LDSTPSFAISDGYAVYRGLVTGGGPIHRHGAFQIAIAVRGAVAMVDPSGTCHRAAALVVSPMAEHRIMASPRVVTYFVEPHCAFADRLRERYDAGITAAPELRDLQDRDIGPTGGGRSRDLDPRLVRALEAMRQHKLSMANVADLVELSPQRLRALARQQLGMPLPRWRVWSRLRSAAEALQSGASLADAAVTAGFADQAHLTRQMREMMGLTPAVVLPALRAQSLSAT
jgi:AraC-like DNA-binding protein